MPPRISSPAVTTITRWKLSTASSPARMTPIIAVAISPATRDTALLVAEPMPAWLDGIEPRIAAVSGATVIERPTAKTSTPGSTFHQ